MKITENYIMGRCGDTIHVVDLKTKKVTRILDLIPEEDREFVNDPSMYLMQDQINLVWETDNALVFKYYSITEDKEETVTCKLG